MKRAIVIMASIFLLVLYGLSIANNSCTYIGENESWNVKYKIKFHETEYESVLIASYKGDSSQLSSEKNITISYQSSSSGGTIIKRFNEEIYTLTSRGEVGSIDKDDQVINVAISIDGKIQNIVLKKTG